MNPNLFDQISRRFSEARVSRRTAVDASLAAATQLFMQSFQSGSIAPSASEFGTHTVTLEQGLGQTIVFTDRPSREVFTSPIPAFLDGLGFDADNPPNAAMIMETADGASDIAVVELFNPSYDEATHTATYDIAVLANWQNDLELGFQEEPTDLSNVATDFGATHLFIDDCGWGTVNCLLDEEIAAVLTNVPTIYFGEHYSCIPYAPGATTFREMDDYLVAMCNNVFPEECQGRCQDGAFLDFL